MFMSTFGTVLFQKEKNETVFRPLGVKYRPKRVFHAWHGACKEKREYQRRYSFSKWVGKSPTFAGLPYRPASERGFFLSIWRDNDFIIWL